MKTISVEYAMKIAWATRLMWIFVFLSAIFLPIIYGVITDRKWIYYLISIPLFISIGYLFSFLITQWWRIWAFANVDNVFELKKYAQEDRFIPEGNLLFEKSEYNSNRYKAKWIELQKRFNEEFVHKLDNTISEKVIIKTGYIKYIFSSHLIVFVFFAPILIPLFIDLALEDKLNQIQIIFTLLPLGLFFIINLKELRILFSPNSLMLDNECLIVDNLDTYFWNKIKNEEVIPYYIGRQRIQALRFDYEQEEIIIQLIKYKINKYKLIDIIKTIRLRTIIK